MSTGIVEFLLLFVQVFAGHFVAYMLVSLIRRDGLKECLNTIHLLQFANAIIFFLLFLNDIAHILMLHFLQIVLNFSLDRIRHAFQPTSHYFYLVSESTIRNDATCYTL